MTARGLIVAGTATGSGKTVLTSGLVRALAKGGRTVAAFKTGPDYLDSAHLSRAAGRAAINLDSWAMDRATLGALLAGLGESADLVIGEGVMGLFDGARGPTRDGFAPGSTAELAHLLDLPVVLVLDARGMGQSVGALARGFATHDPRVPLAGVILNRVASPAHGAFLTDALAEALPGTPVLGAVARAEAMDVPSRHLGLVQAREIGDLDARLDRAGEAISAALDLDRLAALMRPLLRATDVHPKLPPPLGQRIAVAQDDAFAFAYPALLAHWRTAGAEIRFFAPLADESPTADADAVYLPGGYPELHAGRLANTACFRAGLHAAAARGACVFGECGGYMTLGRTLRDSDGTVHAMAGLLPLACDFATRKLHLGYRNARALIDSPLGNSGTVFAGHEFHYATAADEGAGAPLFGLTDAAGNQVGASGRVDGRVMGSFVHLIAQR